MGFCSKIVVQAMNSSVHLLMVPDGMEMNGSARQNISISNTFDEKLFETSAYLFHMLCWELVV